MSLSSLSLPALLFSVDSVGISRVWWVRIRVLLGGFGEFCFSISESSRGGPIWGCIFSWFSRFSLLISGVLRPDFGFGVPREAIWPADPATFLRVTTTELRLRFRDVQLQQLIWGRES